MQITTRYRGRFKVWQRSGALAKGGVKRGAEPVPPRPRTRTAPGRKKTPTPKGRRLLSLERVTGLEPAHISLGS